MRTGVIWSLVVTGVLLAAAAAGLGALSFFIWALALNGFMGQERAVNASLVTFVVLLIVFTLLSLAIGLLTVHFLAARRSWNAAASSLLSTIVATVVIAVLDLMAILISVLVASQLRTTR